MDYSFPLTGYGSSHCYISKINSPMIIIYNWLKKNEVIDVHEIEPSYIEILKPNSMKHLQESNRSFVSKFLYYPFRTPYLFVFRVPHNHLLCIPCVSIFSVSPLEIMLMPK